MIVVRNVTRRYGAVLAVNDLSLEVPAGQVMGLLGENGAGKTTLMNMLSGYTPPTSGSISINGADLVTEPLAARAAIGYMPEQVPVYPELTVREYLSFCLALKGAPRAGRHAGIADAARMAGVYGILDKRIGTLSKGYRQRVGFAQALCGNPPVLLLDEPTAGFDPAQSAEFRAAVRSLAGSHTIILCSHILSEIESMCDRVGILKAGRLAHDHPAGETAATGVRSVRLSVQGDCARLSPALRALPTVDKLIVARAAAADEFSATIVTRDPAQLGRDVVCLLSGLGLSLTSFRPVEQTLEELFLKVVQSAPAPMEQEEAS